MSQGGSKQQLIDQLVEQLIQEGVLDDQFSQLLQLQDESNPDFIEEVITLYFDDSASKLQKLSAQLSITNPNYAEVDQTVHQLKGSSASLGARAIARSCVQLREACQQSDLQRCQALTQRVQGELVKLRGGLQSYQDLVAQ